jgi:hypothetical protein
VNPQIAINNVSVTEGNSGTTNLTFTATLSGSGSDLPVRVNYATSPGTALSPADFTAESGSVTFTPGQTSRAISIAVRGDTLDENNETFSVILSSPQLGTIQDGTGIGTIIDDDDPPTVSVQDFRLAEGNAGTTAFNFSVTLSAPSAKTVTVLATTAPATATSPSDYTHRALNLVFDPGETSQTFTVQVNGDTTVEADEQFLVNLSNPANATLGDGQGIGTILNDDVPPAPVVTQVYVSGAGWPAAFRDAFGPVPGGANYGFPVPHGGPQLAEMPWINANQVSIAFSSDVLVDADDLVINGLNVATYATDPAAFLYNAADRVATWRLAPGAVFRADRVTVNLNAGARDGVRTAAGALLDGEWTSGRDLYPSGDGTAGGDFVFALNFLPGSVDRANNRVNSTDVTFVRSRQNRILGEVPPAGVQPYTPFVDINGDGRINAVDVTGVRARLNDVLPPPPLVPLASPTPLFGDSALCLEEDAGSILLG